METRSARHHNAYQLNYQSKSDCDTVSENLPANFNKKRKASCTKINPLTGLESLNKTEFLQEHGKCIENTQKLKEKKNLGRKFSRRNIRSNKERKSKRLMSNERERVRNRNLTVAFKLLGRVIPSEERSRKFSKIQILISAKNHITNLTNTILRMNGLPTLYHQPEQDKGICLTKGNQIHNNANNNCSR